MINLTRDKPLLSKSKNADFEADIDRAIDCTTVGRIDLGDRVSDFVRDSLADHTRRAYASDLKRFEVWGGQLPAAPESIAAYLTSHADTHAPSTLVRWLASLSKAHRVSRMNDPTKSELVKSVLRGIRRRYGRPPEQAAPLTRDILFEVLDAIPDDVRGKRDRALLLIGFAGGFRRSELVTLEVDDLDRVEEGMIVTIRRSKTDQSGQGRKIGIPFARGRHCPVKALMAWLDVSQIAEGPIFRPVDRHALMAAGRLSGQSVSLLIKERLAAAHLDPTGFSGHSLRSGFVTSAAKAGVASWKIRQQTGHASDTMLARYIRDTEIFADNAAGALL